MHKPSQPHSSSPLYFLVSRSLSLGAIMALIGGCLGAKTGTAPLNSAAPQEAPSHQVEDRSDAANEPELTPAQSAQAEVEATVQLIKTHLHAYEAREDAFVEIPPFPLAAPGAAMVDWSGQEHGFDAIYWEPESPLYGQYWVTVSDLGGSLGQDFTVWGRSDADGDGEFEIYTATKRSSAALQ
jgi:hypothetical protein